MNFRAIRKPPTGLSLSRRSRQRLDLLLGLVDREIKLLYNRSFLGIAWMLLNPLMQLAVFAFVFSLVLQTNLEHYSSFIFSGLLVWTWFQTALTQATGAIVYNRALIRQPGFPVAILPIVTVTTGLIHLLLSLPILILFLWIDGVTLHGPLLLLLPVLMTIQFALTVGLAYGLAAINVTFRDTQHTLGVLLQMLFYLSGVFYEVGTIPAGYQQIFYLNPMVHLIAAYRDILLKGQAPNWGSLLPIAVAIALLLPLGHWIFQRQSERFVEEL